IRTDDRACTDRFAPADPPRGRHDPAPRLTRRAAEPTTIGESERAGRRTRAAERRPLGILDEFEKGLERVVNGAFAKTFKSGLQPLEVTAALRRELDTKAAVVARDRILVPNRFTVRLSPSDHERMTGLGPALIDEFTRLVQQHATAQRYTFAGGIDIRLQSDPKLSAGIVRIDSENVKGEVN